MARASTAIGIILAAPFAAALFANPVVFYGGNFDGRNEITSRTVRNAGGTVLAEQRVYDDFALSSSSDIAALFANFFSSITPTGYLFEIRSGVSSGNGGTVVATGGATSGFTWQATGHTESITGHHLQEFTLRADVSAFNLPAGTYHLNIRPVVADDAHEIYLSTTSGAGGIGSPRNNGNAFISGGPGNLNFMATSSAGFGNLDFSQGVELVPLPMAAASALPCLLALGLANRRRR